MIDLKEACLLRYVRAVKTEEGEEFFQVQLPHYTSSLLSFKAVKFVKLSCALGIGLYLGCIYRHA